MLPSTYKDQFLELLAETGNVSRSAKILGINRMTAYSWKEDIEFTLRWNNALQVARQGLRDKVIETAIHLGVGKWAPVNDPATGQPLLDDDFNPVLQFETSNVDPRILSKLMDKTIQDEVQHINQQTMVINKTENQEEPAQEFILVDCEGNEKPLLGNNNSDILELQTNEQCA